jgi:hypothetical protein
MSVIIPISTIGLVGIVCLKQLLEKIYEREKEQ